MTAPSHERLGRVKIFSDLAGNTPALTALATIMTERTYRVNSVLIEEGSIGSELYVLIDGQVSVIKTPPGSEPFRVALLSAELFPTFGESGLIESEARSATIRCDTEIRCLILERGAFDRFSDKHPEWALPIIRRVAQSTVERFKKINNDMMLLYNALMSEIRGG